MSEILSEILLEDIVEMLDIQLFKKYTLLSFQ